MCIFFSFQMRSMMNRLCLLNKFNSFFSLSCVLVLRESLCLRNFRWLVENVFIISKHSRRHSTSHENHKMLMSKNSCSRKRHKKPFQTPFQRLMNFLVVFLVLFLSSHFSYHRMLHDIQYNTRLRDHLY